MNKNSENDFKCNFILVLKKITCPDFDVDNTYLEKLLTSINLEYDIEFNKYISISNICTWLSETLQLWKSNHPNTHVATFVCQLIGILSRNEKGFKFFQQKNLLNELHNSYSSLTHIDNIKVSYIKYLSNIICNKLGYEWVVTNKYWKSVITYYVSSSNFYIEQEAVPAITWCFFLALIFFQKFIKDYTQSYLITEILNEALLPVENIFRIYDHNPKYSFCMINLPFKFLVEIIKISIPFNVKGICLELEKTINFEKFVKFVLDNCTEERTLEITSSLYILYLTSQYCDNKKLCTIKESQPKILKLFEVLLQKNYINCVIKLFKYCQLLYNEISRVFNCEVLVELDYIIFQFVPFLTYSNFLESVFFEFYNQKIFGFMDDSCKKFGHLLIDTIKRKNDFKDWALKGLLAATSSLNSLNEKGDVVVYQILASTLELFLQNNICDSVVGENKIKKFKKEIVFCLEDVSFLSTILNALSIIVKKREINWMRSSEDMSLIKMSCLLLENTQLPLIINVRTLLLLKCAFENCHFNLLMGDSDFKNLSSLLYKHMHNPNWEIRDSCIEVVTRIFELHRSRSSHLLDLLVENNFFTLICHLVDNDSESFVRASGLRALSAMINIKKIRVKINYVEFSSKITQILHTETEGIVRQEAVLLIKEIYLTFNEESDVSNLLYQSMSYSALCDLHWEVKINSLHFWEAVIYKKLAEQKIISQSFLEVLTSKKYSKLATAKSEDVKIVSEKILDELSNVGCFYVLLSALHNDCDFQVIKKSAEILSSFLKLINKGKEGKFLTSDKIDSTYSINELPKIEESVIHTKEIDNLSTEIINYKNIKNFVSLNSNAVIEEIVNEVDLNLLVKINSSQTFNCPSNKKVVLNAVKPKAFLAAIQYFDFELFLKEKLKLLNLHTDVKSLVNDMIEVNTMCETNVMDCY